MLGTRTQSSSMEGTDESTELWRHPRKGFIVLARIVNCEFFVLGPSGDTHGRPQTLLSYPPQTPKQRFCLQQHQRRANKMNEKTTKTEESKIMSTL